MSDRLAFVLTAELRRRTDAAIASVRDDPASRAARDELVAVIEELTETGLDYYFLLPLRQAGVGRITRGSAEVGVAAARRGIPPLVRRILRSLSATEILGIVDFLDAHLIRDRVD